MCPALERKVFVSRFRRPKTALLPTPSNRFFFGRRRGAPTAGIHRRCRSGFGDSRAGGKEWRLRIRPHPAARRWCSIYIFQAS